MPLNLPSLVELSDFGGVWSDYIDTLDSIFNTTLLDPNITFEGLPLSLRRHPESFGYHYTFWHLTTGGDPSAPNRLYDLNRCSRLSWVRFFIDNYEDADFKVWENRRNGNVCKLILHERERFIVVLTKRTGYWMLSTAYYIEHNNRLRKLLSEYHSSTSPI